MMRRRGRAGNPNLALLARGAAADNLNLIANFPRHASTNNPRRRRHRWLIGHCRLPAAAIRQK
jgi:hypothetical protein